MESIFTGDYIPTQFSVDGSLYKNLKKSLNELSQPITDFKEEEKCFVLDYLGRDNYRVKYKEWVGIVAVDDLEVNEEMMDLYYAYQEKQRARAITVKENRQKKVNEIAKKEEERLAAIREKFVKDSIAKVVAQQKLINEQFLKDSVAKAVAKQKLMMDQFVSDSLAKVVARQKRIREDFVKDSIAQVNLEKNLVR
ncbi:hypothetical protein [uncultured Algibacter sp.]|uniref:hypothetical protein n=1 Tax=uncultured Algibacter sp. TaxID=298659 RepID=UPI002626AEAF|nr:hypothetical protein [uncultured Algibacter sp.]